MNRRTTRTPTLLGKEAFPRCEEGDDFKQLSDEIILNIFSYLPKVSLCKAGLTCRRLRMLSLDESLWKRVDLGGKSVSVESLHMLLQRGVQYLRLAKANIFETDWLNPTSLDPCQLRYLDLSMISCNEQALINEILIRCTQLVAVSLENCLIDEQSCAALGKNVGLKILNLSSVQGLTTLGIRSILRGCRFLEELNVAWTQLNRDSVNLLCANAPRSLLRLNLAGCRTETLFDADIIMLCTICPNLIELDISDALELTGLAVNAIAELLPKLTVLSVSRCYKVDPAWFVTLPRALTHLNIFNSVQDHSWAMFIRMLPEFLKVNKTVCSTIARPTVGPRRTSIWGHRVRDE